jgi:hypothetical protein
MIYHKISWDKHNSFISIKNKIKISVTADIYPPHLIHTLTLTHTHIHSFKHIKYRKLKYLSAISMKISFIRSNGGI